MEKDPLWAIRQAYEIVRKSNWTPEELELYEQAKRQQEQEDDES